MSSYVKAVDFESKDSLTTGNPLKIIKGVEINDEFNAIQTAIASKADLASPNFLGNPTATTQPAGNNSTRLATTAFVFQNSVPIGAILMWGGSIVSIPSGYALCDGTSGTPDLRDRFVVGAGTTYVVGDTGGSKDAIIVSHTHTITDPGHTHTVVTAGEAAGGGRFVSGGDLGGPLTIDSNTTGISVNSSGVSGTNANLPPYYALAFIQRVS